MKIRCTTLFDITKTNVSNRRKNLEISNNTLQNKERNQQSNFETILQVISLRSQPENITDPEKIQLNLEKDARWGKKYKSKNKIFGWTFTFTINHSNVFNLNDDKLGNLLLDCNDVPMITKLEEFENIHNTLSTHIDNCNIYFEIENDD